VEAVWTLRVDAASDGEASEATSKGIGYGEPLRIRVRLPGPGAVRRELVLHTARADQFGHDRRADRAQQMLLAYDTFGRIPQHVPALDVGAVHRDGHLVSLRDSGEFYLITEYRPGRLYADDLRRIAHEARLAAGDLQRCDALAGYLAALHRPREPDPVRYGRAIRDLVGHGEGIFGIIDGYPRTAEVATGRLRAIERLCVEWRWRLRDAGERLTTIHGDFHPFNLLHGEDDELILLDASRGCRGDAADDLTCLAINYVFFALDLPGAWPGGLSQLWYRLWNRYLEYSGDTEILEVAPPFLAWRALVLANPLWYPALSGSGRDALLTLCERVLAAGRLDLRAVEEVMT
jgi:hypothetical protein